MKASKLLDEIRTVVNVAESCGGSDVEDQVSAYLCIRTLITRHWKEHVFCAFEDCDQEPDSTGFCEHHRQRFPEPPFEVEP